MNKFIASAVVAVGCLIGGCMSTNLGVGLNISDCCYPELLDYQSFGITVKNTPEFLKPFIVDTMAQAMLEKGLIRDDASPDLMISLIYQQTDLKEELKKDEFQGYLSPGGDFRFNAAVVIEIRDMRSSTLVWSGSINRYHDVDVGEYMHKPGTRRAIFNAIKEVIKDFPGRSTASPTKLILTIILDRLHELCGPGSKSIPEFYDEQVDEWICD